MGSKSSVLTIETIRDYHAGVYSCFGKNAAGIANHSVALVVNGSKLAKINFLPVVLLKNNLKWIVFYALKLCLTYVICFYVSLVESQISPACPLNILIVPVTQA